MSDIYMRILLSAQDAASGVIRGVVGLLGEGGLAGGLAIAGVAAGALAIGLGVESVKAASNFQQAMLSNVAHAGLAKSQFDSTSQAVLNMATQVGRSPTELAEALYPILSGFSGIQDQSAKSSVALQTLKDSFEAVAGTTVNGTDVANAAVGTFNALGLATNNASTNASRMNSLFDVMDKTVQLGNMQWSSYKNVISKLAVSVQGTGITFNEASAALATMTNEGFSAQRAQTYLSNTFNTLSIKTDTLAKHAKALKIPFDENAYSSMNFADKLKYLNEITDGNKQKLLALMGNNSTALKTFNALSSGIQGYQSNLDSLNHSQGALQQSFSTASQGFNFAMQRLGAAGQVLLITLGSKLLPILTQLVNAVVPVVAAFASWIASGQGIGAAMSFLHPLFAQLAPIFQQIGAQLMANFIPAWHQLQPALQAALPVLEIVAKVLGGVLVVAIGIVIGLIAGLAKGFAMALPPIAQMLAGLIGMVTGVFNVIMGIGNLFHDLFTGNFKKVGADLKQIWTGIQQIAQGFGNFMMGLFGTVVNFIIGLVSGFVNTIVGFFKGLFNALVGHSIIPDMVNGIINYFGQLPGRAIAFIHQLISQALGALNNFASGMLQVGANIVNNIAQGIRNAIGAVGSAISSVASFISAHLPHSPAKVGPLVDLIKQGSLISEQISQGMLQGMPTVQTSLNTLLAPAVAAPATGISPLQGGSRQPVSGPVFYISIHTMARSQSEVSNLVDLVEQEIAKRFRTQTSGYAAGGIF
jgi:TP901 family phage tail tape measure protein